MNLSPLSNSPTKRHSHPLHRPPSSHLKGELPLSIWEHVGDAKHRDTPFNAMPTAIESRRVRSWADCNEDDHPFPSTRILKPVFHLPPLTLLEEETSCDEGAIACGLFEKFLEIDENFLEERAQKERGGGIIREKLDPLDPLNLNPVFTKEWLFKGSQDGCCGSVSIPIAENICEKLNNLAPLGVYFDKSAVVDYIDGGTCSAMALEFLHCYLKIKKEWVLEKDQRTDVLLDRISSLAGRFICSSQERRNAQAAYNTIKLKGRISEYPYRDKVQALANDYLLSIKLHSKEIDMCHVQSPSELYEKIKNLPEGAYFVRMLMLTNDGQHEECGHSLLYIKECGIELFYDPNCGLRNLSLFCSCVVLFQCLMQCVCRFKTNKTRFYLMTQSSELKSACVKL